MCSFIINKQPLRMIVVAKVAILSGFLRVTFQQARVWQPKRKSRALGT